MFLQKVIRSFYVCLMALMAIQAHAHNPHPLGHFYLDWTPDKNLARTIVMNIDFHGGGSFVSWEKPGRVEKRGEHQCIVGPYFFFDVHDNYAFNIDETVTLELLVDRELTEGFNLSYDQAIKPTAKQVILDKNYEERFETVKVELERARFANRKYEKTDFSLGALGSQHPSNPEFSGQLAVCGMKISRSHTTPVSEKKPGTFTLSVLNEKGNPDSVRVGLYREDGYSPLVDNSAVTLIPFIEEFKQWPLNAVVKGWHPHGRYAFYVDGEYQTQLPSGDYDLVVYKGPEYRISKHKVTVREGENTELNIDLKRWIDMPAKGWYSGDGHIHISRPDETVNESTLAFTRAEDIHVANLLQVSNVASQDNYPQYEFGHDGHYVEGHHSLVSGQESPRSAHRGHAIGLNANEYHWRDDYFLYDEVAKLIHADGGMFGYAHVALNAFNVGYSLALDVANQHADFIEVLQMGHLNTEYLYDFWNMGFKLLPSAGSDHPFIHIVGSERMYAHLSGEFSPHNWFDAWQNKRSFVSNGPILAFSVNGDTERSEYNITKGQSLKISAQASVNPDIDDIERIELVVHGKVVHSAHAKGGDNTIKIDYEIKPEESQWIAVRAFGKGKGIAHSSAVYVYVDGNKQFWNKSEAPQIAEKYLGILAQMKASTPNPGESWERHFVEGKLVPKWKQNKGELDQSIEQASQVYKALQKKAKQ